jgi:hypothetical protein
LASVEHAGTVHELLADHFHQFATTAARRHPVTRRLAASAAEDHELLDLVADVPLTRRPSNLLLAAAHDLLLRGTDHPLAAWYPTVGGDPSIDDDPAGAFRSLLLGHRDEVRRLVSTRETQTNEVGRCGVLRAGLVIAARAEPVAVVDVGASAGLTLGLDRYRIVYEPDGTAMGPVDSSVEVRCTIRSGRPPTGPLTITARVGLDRSPVRLDDVEATRWLVACVWPDDAARADRLVAALELARQDPPHIVTGDAVRDLASVVPPDGTVVVQHSWIAAYLGEDGQRAFATEVERLALDRPADAPLRWLFAEQPAEVPGLPVPPGKELPTALVLVSWEDGARRVVRLADTHPHGASMDWFGDGSPADRT